MKQNTNMKFIILNKIILFSVLIFISSCSPKQPLIKSHFKLTEKNRINPFGNGLKRITNYNVKNNKIFIKDSESNSIFVYDLNGNFISRFGKKGKGPGELNYLSSFSILKDKYILLDTVKRKFIEFNKDYRFVREYEFPADIKINYAEFYDYDSSIFSFVLITRYDKKSWRDFFSFYKFTLNFKNPNKLFDVYSYLYESWLYDRFHNRLVWAISPENNRVAIYLSQNIDNFNIDIFNLQGDKLSKLRHKFNPIKFSKTSIKRVKDDYEYVKSKYPKMRFGKIPKFYDSVDFMEYDNAGNLWVLSDTKDYYRAVFTIFDKSLKEVGEIFIPIHTNYFRIWDKYLILLDSRDEDNKSLIIYNIESSDN